MTDKKLVDLMHEYEAELDAYIARSNEHRRNKGEQAIGIGDSGARGYLAGALSGVLISVDVYGDAKVKDEVRRALECSIKTARESTIL